MPSLSDREFVSELRDVVHRFLRAVDAWEHAWAQYYRLPARGSKQLTPELEQAQKEYAAAHRQLKSRIGRARALSFRYGLRDPWAGLVRVSLGEYAPQVRNATAIGMGERTAVMECLVQLAEAVEHTAPAGTARRPPRAAKPSWIQRLLDFFF